MNECVICVKVSGHISPCRYVVILAQVKITINTKDTIYLSETVQLIY